MSISHPKPNRKYLLLSIIGIIILFFIVLPILVTFITTPEKDLDSLAKSQAEVLYNQNLYPEAIKVNTIGKQIKDYPDETLGEDYSKGDKTTQQQMDEINGDLKSEKKNGFSSSCPSRPQQIYYDKYEYRFKGANVMVKNTIKFTVKSESATLLFFDRKCKYKAMVESSELLYNNRLIDKCVLSKGSGPNGYGAFFKVEFAQSSYSNSNTNGYDLISAKCDNMQAKIYNPSKTYLTFQGDPNLQIIPNLAIATSKTDGENSIDWQSGEFASNSSYYKHLYNDYDTSIISIWDMFSKSSWKSNPSGLVRNVEKLGENIVFTMDDGTVKCRETKALKNDLYSNCGRKLVFSKKVVLNSKTNSDSATDSYWQFDLKASMDALEGPAELKNLKLNWDEQKAAELVKKVRGQ